MMRARRGGACRSAAIFAAARSLAVAPALILLAGEAAWADCTPASASNVTATCSGTTLNQGGGPPGTSADPNGNGYGTGTETGIAITVESNASVTGTEGGIAIGAGSLTINAGATVSGPLAIWAATGSINITNSGSISVSVGGVSDAIYAYADATVTNNAGATITGGWSAINAGQFTNGSITLINSGSVLNTFSGYADLYAWNNVTVVNNAGANITGYGNAIWGHQGFVDVTNSGSISGTTPGNGLGSAILAGTYVAVTNNAGASITGAKYGIYAGGGSSTVFNAGTISGGTAAIRFAGTGNTLTLAPGSVITGNVLGTGSDTFQLGGTGAAAFDVSQLGPAAQYQGFGSFNKIGSSNWTLTGTSNYAGPVTVNGGTLNVDGDISSTSGVTVNAGAILGGTGIVSATAINGGALAPGSSTALLTVQGGLTFTAASSYMVEVSPTSAGRTNVMGTATLNGATLNASFVPGGYVARQYTILNATGGINGKFGAVVFNSPASITPSLSYDADNAYLNVAINFAVPGGLNQNQQNVASALTNFFNSTGGIPVTFAALTPAGLTQASGEIATATQQTSIDAMTQFMGVMTGPFTAGRGNPGSSASAFAEPGDPSNAYGMITTAPPLAPFERRWNVWTAGFGGSQTTAGNAAVGSSTAASGIGGVAVGADYWLSPQTVAGFALAGGGTSFGVVGSGSGRSELFQAGGFVRHTVGSAYISAAAAYGWQEVTTDRAVTIAGIDQLQAQFNSNAYSARVEAGNRYVLPWIGGIGLTPYAAAQVIALDLPAYAEGVVAGAGSFALDYAAKTVTATRSELGLRSDKSFAVDDAILTLRGRAAWAHDYDTDRDVAATFQTLPGASFVVSGAAPAHDAALTTASAELKFTSGLSLAATFEGEFSDVTRSYAGKGVARYSW